MSNTTQNEGGSPLNEDKTPNTRNSSAYPPHFLSNIYKALFPYVDFSDGVDNALSDSHEFILERVIGQVQLLQDLGNKITGSEDLEGQALASTAESISRQLAVLGVIHQEYYKQVQGHKKELAGLAETKNDLEAMMRVIDRLKSEIKDLKGGVA